MARTYWRGVAGCLLWIGGLVTLMGLSAGDEGRLLLWIGAAILFFTVQGIFLLNGGHIQVRLQLEPTAYRWMSWVWVGLFGAATATVGLPVAASLRAGPAPAVAAAALLLLLIPAGCAAIMTWIGLRLRRAGD